MSDIDRLEIKIKADATEAESALKKLNQQLSTLGKGVDATKGVRELKDAVESIKAPDMQIGGIEKFSELTKVASGYLSEMEKSAKAISEALGGVNFSKTEKPKKEKSPEPERNWDEIPMFDIGTPMNEAAATIKEQEDAIKAAVSETKELSSAFTETAKSVEPAVDQTREFLRNLNQITSGMTGIDRVDSGEMAQDLERARQVVSGLKEEYEKLGRTWSRFSFPKISKETKNLNKMERQLKALIDEYIKLRIEGKDTPIRVKPVLKEIDRLQKEIGKTAQETVKLATAAKASVGRLKGESLTDNTKKKKGKNRTGSGGSRKKNSGFSIFNMIGMSVLYSGVFQTISGIERAVAEGVQSMAQYSSGVNGYLSSMMSSLTMLRNAFAAAFEPILSVVVPYLATFISWLARALNMLGQFFAALTGKGYAIQAKKVTQDYAASIGGVSDSAKGATEALKNMYSLGFDELHTIDTSAGAGGGGAGGGGADLAPGDMFETVEIDSKIQALAKALKDIIPLVGAIATGFALWKLGPTLWSDLQKLQGTLKKLNMLSKITFVMQGIGNTIGSIGLLLSNILKLSPTMLGWIGVIALLSYRFIDLVNSSESFRVGLERINEVMHGVWTVISDVFGGILMVITMIGSAIWDNIVKPFLEFIGIDTSAIEAAFKRIKDWIDTLDLNIGDLMLTLGGLALLLIPGGQIFGVAILGFEAISVAARAFGSVSEETWNSIKTSAIEAWDNIKKWAVDRLNEIASYYPTKIAELKQAWDDLREDVLEIFRKLPDGIYKTFTAFGEKFKALGRWMWQGIKDGFMSPIPSGAKDAVSGILRSTQKAAEIHSPSKLFKREVGVYMGEGIIEGLKESTSAIGNVVSSITDSISGNTGIDTTVSVEAPDITQWSATFDLMAVKFYEVKEGITASMTEFYSNMQSMLVGFSVSAQSQLQDFFPRLYQYIYNVFDAIRQTLQEVSDEVVKMLNNLVREANKLAALTGGKHYSYASNYIMKKASMFDIGKFAEGGFPRAGELFIANEAGPEMVGRIGNRTAVGSSDQIENAIYMAVLTAMSQVMAQSSSQPIELNQTIELDGDVIYNNQQRVASRRGIDFGLGAFQR